MNPGYAEWNPEVRRSPDRTMRDASPPSPSLSDYIAEPSRRRPAERTKPVVKYSSQRRPSNRDEFDGDCQWLEMPSPKTISSQERDLPHLPTNLDVQEQDEILSKVNDRLSECSISLPNTNFLSLLSRTKDPLGSQLIVNGLSGYIF
jgi:hypothetical protein